MRGQPVEIIMGPLITLCLGAAYPAGMRTAALDVACLATLQNNSLGCETLLNAVRPGAANAGISRSLSQIALPSTAGSAGHAPHF